METRTNRTTAIASSARDRRGFTLVELIVGTLLALVVTVGAGSVYLSTERSYKIGSQKLTAQQEASLLAKWITLQARPGASFIVYNAAYPGVPADPGDSVDILSVTGATIATFRWDGVQKKMVDGNGNPVNTMHLQSVVFRRDSVHPRTLRYSFKTDDDYGDLVDIEGGTTMRN